MSDRSEAEVDERRILPVETESPPGAIVPLGFESLEIFARGPKRTPIVKPVGAASIDEAQKKCHRIDSRFVSGYDDRTGRCALKTETRPKRRSRTERR